MIDVQFDENQNSGGGIYPLRPSLNRQATSASVRWLIKIGLARNERSAGYVLMMIALVCFSASAVIVYFSLPRGRSGPTSEIPLLPDVGDSQFAPTSR